MRLITEPRLQMPAPLSPASLSLLASEGFCVVPRWLPPEFLNALLEDSKSLYRGGLTRDASVGSRRDGPEMIRMNDNVRRALVCPLYPPPRPSAGNVDARLHLYDVVRSLGEELGACTALNIEPLSLFDTELAYLFYPEGGFYLRHIDVPLSDNGWRRLGRSDADGGSYSQTAIRREISALCYLNSCWDSNWGGQLRIFPPGGAPLYVDVTPEGGTLVLLRSGLVPHEVLRTCRERQCIVGWFRSLRTKS